MSRTFTPRTHVPSHSKRRPGAALGIFFLGAGELFVTLGLVILLFLAYELWGTNDYTRQVQHRLSGSLRHQWSLPPSKINLANGEPMGVIRIPRLGRNYRFVIVEGTDEADLRKGPGHYHGSALPGQVGNFAVAGHRTTYLAPFNRLDELHRGDRIIIDAHGREYTYRVSWKRVVVPTAVQVADPVPYRPGAVPRHALITLTTCHPKYSASHRLVVSGHLVGRKVTRSPDAFLGER